MLNNFILKVQRYYFYCKLLQKNHLKNQNLSFPLHLSYLPYSFFALMLWTLPKSEALATLKATNNILLIYILVLTYLHFFSAFCSFFVRSLFVFSSSFLRSLFVFPSFIVRLLFVHCSSYFFRYYTPSPWERGGERIFPSPFLYLPVRLTPSFVRSLFFFPISFSQINH